MAMQILLTDNVILNGGDSAILKGTIDSLKDDLGINQSSLTIHCDYYDTAVTHYPELPLKRSIQEAIRMFPPKFFWRYSHDQRFFKLNMIALSRQEKLAYSDYKKSDIVITCGGSFLTDAYALDLTLLGFDIALNAGLPTYLIGQSLGPFKSSDKKKQVAKRLIKMEKIIVRDHRSYLEAIDMGCDEKRVFEAKDMAFNLKVEKNSRIFNTSDLTIGVSVRKWTFPYSENSEADYNSYIKTMAEFTSLLIEKHNAKIIFISTCQGDESYSFKDHLVAKEIVSHMDHLNINSVSIISEFQSPETFLNNLDAIDIFIGTRMHACILALLKNIPTLNICYEFKSKELFNSMGLGNFVCDIENLELDSLSQKAEKLLLDHESISTTIHTKTVEFRTINSRVMTGLFK